MQDTMKRRIVRLGASALAAGVAVLGIALPASAAPANIDPNADVTLTLHKYEQPGAGNLGPNDGTEIPNPSGTPLEGVEFTFQKVTNIDLLTNEGWAAVDGLKASDVMGDPAKYPLGNEIVRVTDNAGKIELAKPDVEIGLYLVRETASGPNPIVEPAVPFLVALPLPSPTGDGTWNANVHVYPKNALSTITKTVDDSDAQKIGDAVTWTIEAGVPTLPEGTSYTSYQVSDSLDPRLGFQSIALTLVGNTTTNLVAGTDYTLTAPATGASGDVRADFTAAGLAKLATAGAGAKVHAELTTTILSLGNGNIENEATVFINDPKNGHTSEPAVTHWGGLKILKFADGDESKTLAGAEFSIYAVDPAQNPGATPILTQVTTDAQGIALVEGLKVGSYWLVETKAPAGYELDATPIRVDVTAGSITDAVIVKVANTQVPPFTLPLTGGQGTALFVIGGGALLAAAATAFLIARRRRTRLVSEE
ncbi:SpaH/EbpB family LPXTG-anchored major pilin [Leucobacter sp. CSA2]|uniref:SpaH/EbpB family LPXTG-anchored major pilin n=1 Tax=Leucobacter edaphi TaxID=2796472 RepID=A0A934QAC4_9MICO|nr:SpaH/EbpB family LPXTG-anchored major pilin [Leucobacter edaphi]MBK0421064.1 SpaH/EbpB family LPXTG-anchored major pilin [Leucobacter edaphi]